MDTEKNAGWTRQIWFAAANSEHGFENHFPALFSAAPGRTHCTSSREAPEPGKAVLCAG